MKRLGILLVLMLTTVSYAQYTKGNTVIAWSKYKFKPPSEIKDYKSGDRGKALLEYHTKRNSKSTRLKSSLFLTHYWTGKQTDVNILNEFSSMEGATYYSGNSSDLNKKAWPKEDERKAAVSGNGKNFRSYHEDVHIFENHVKLEKKKIKSKDSPNTVVAVTTRYWKPLSQVEGGSADERDKLMQKYHKKVTMKNDKIISRRTVTHLWTGAVSGGYWGITAITEFASMADADDSVTGSKLYEKAFKTEEDRAGFNKYWGLFFE